MRNLKVIFLLMDSMERNYRGSKAKSLWLRRFVLDRFLDIDYDFPSS
jgi:hypothetical protein